MSPTHSPRPLFPPYPRLPRLLGSYPPVADPGDPFAPADGKTLVAICAAHGNEPAGIAAAQSVLAALEDGGGAVVGRFVAVIANRAALVAGVRYIDTDLNRLWTDARVTALDGDVRSRARDVPPGSGDTARVPSPVTSGEHAEQAELHAALTRLAGPPDAPNPDVAMIDLHTTSSTSAPFAIALPTARNRRLLAGVTVPLVHGLETRLAGTLTSWLSQRGHAAVSVEGGAHDDPGSATNLAHVLMLALANHGVLARDADGVARRTAEMAVQRAALAAASRGRPRSVAVAYRHAIAPGDGFVMRPGYRNFQPVRPGEEVATSVRGPVRAPIGGALLFPLYQGLGDDGFFIAHRLSTRWPPAAVRSLEVPT